jgi:hypothetical protein
MVLHGSMQSRDVSHGAVDARQFDDAGAHRFLCLRETVGAGNRGMPPLPMCRPGKDYFNLLRRSGIDFQIEVPMFRAETGRLIHLTVLPRNFK